MNPLLITDLDNTLYNWVDYYALSFRGMVHAISREMNLEEEVVIQGFKEVFSKRESLEYSFSIQELPFINKYSKKEIERFIDVGKKVFSIVRSKNLKPYDGVSDTLNYLRNDGVIIVGITSAPSYFGELRLKQLKLDKYFYGIGGWEGHAIPEDGFTEEIDEKVRSGKFLSRYIKKRWNFTKDQTKPSPFSYLQVLDSLKISHKTTYIIGDSISKDLFPAKEIGAITIWAKYGNNYQEKNFETLLKITHWNESKIKSTYEEQNIIPSFTINHFSELKNIVHGVQLGLFR